MAFSFNVGADTDEERERIEALLTNALTAAGYQVKGVSGRRVERPNLRLVADGQRQDRKRDRS